MSADAGKNSETPLPLTTIMQAIQNLGLELNNMNKRLDALANRIVGDNAGVSGQKTPSHESRWQPLPSCTAGHNDSSDRQPRLRIDPPRFNGEDLVDWIFRIQQYFDYFSTAESERLQLVGMFIDHPASEWFRYYLTNSCGGTWVEFLQAVKQRFDPDHYADYVSLLSRLQQQTSVMAYQTAFEGLLNKVSGIPESTLISMYKATGNHPGNLISYHHPKCKTLFVDLINGDFTNNPGQVNGLYNGAPSIIFSAAEEEFLAGKFSRALIRRSKERISLSALEDFLVRGGFKEFKLRRLGNFEVLFIFKQEDDYQRWFYRRRWNIQGILLTICKWSPNHSPNHDNPISPLWVEVSHVPVHLNDHRALFTIASSLGRPIKLDAKTVIGATPGKVRFCVEMDVSIALPPRIHVWLGERDIWLLCKYEQVMDYCASCSGFGHAKTSCRKCPQILSGNAPAGTGGTVLNPATRSHISSEVVPHDPALAPCTLASQSMGSLDDGWIGTRFEVGETSSPLDTPYGCHSEGGNEETPFDTSELLPLAMDIPKGPKSSLPLPRCPRVKPPPPPPGFGNIFEQARKAEEYASLTQEAYDLDPTDSKRETAQLANAKLILAVKKEVEYWKQKANIKWLEKGDTNSKVFQAYVRGKQKKLSINHIISKEGKGIHNKEELKEEAINFFKAQFSADHCPNLEPILQHIPTLITAEDDASITALPNLEEVKHTIWEMDANSTSGPDGFNGTFFKCCWDIIQQDVLKASQDFFLGMPIPKGYGSTFLTLIPKKSQPKTFDDFRPISLSTFMSKINTKLLANRLKNLLPKIIAEEQAAFQKGKGIEDHILMAKEAIHHLDRKVFGGNLIVKIDMAKAFDRMDLSYLESILKGFGFSCLSIKLLMANLKSTFISILLNGEPTGFFQMTRGVKQGDPLSPLLFIIGGEGFSRLLNHHLETTFIKRYNMGSFKWVGHLIYADDLIIFTKGDTRNLLRLKGVLLDYLGASGQQINYNKSHFYCSKNTSKEQISHIEKILGMTNGSFPFTYLGRTICKGVLRKEHCFSLLEHFDNHISSWYSKILNQMGRLILIKHVLSSIPLHIMAVHTLPKSIHARLNTLMANFYWGRKVVGLNTTGSSGLTYVIPEKQGG
ncbi:unnamed protein product [Cuscuta campestris]|uniref:Reverse transcriptase domain-containing protein n=1 Tax=Cuscuta campestris TaxID=132261 RepID=A0A484L0W4_9ASTE|nr:unnamed protein product [Cuscuta campestris]